MHSFLLIASDPDLVKEVEKLSKKVKAQLTPFPLAKIEDVRALSRISRLSQDRPCAIYIKSIDEATIEAQNAFLKALEEPQDNLYYVLSATSSKKVLPTILSRCQVIRVKSKKLKVESEKVSEFLRLKTPEKLLFVDSIKKREEAVNFLDELISSWHQDLVKGNGDWVKNAQNLKKAVKVLNALYANGNVLLQLTNFVIRIS